MGTIEQKIFISTFAMLTVKHLVVGYVEDY